MKTAESAKFMTANPMVRKLSRVKERDQEHVTLKGIANKCLYFFITIGIGVLLAVLLQQMGMKIDAAELTEMGLAPVSVMGLAGLAVSAVLMLVVPIIAFLARRASAVLGTVYCIGIGYFYAFACIMVEEYRLVTVLAAGITILVCLAMVLLYRSGKFTVTSKMKKIVTTLLIASVLGSVLITICRFVPQLQFIAAAFAGNGLLSILLAVVGVVIAAAFLLIDFDTVAKAAEEQLPKEYEWYCAFSLMFSVIWLFGEIFNLILAVTSKK